MSSEFKCRLCQCQVTCLSKTSASVQKALLEHFSEEHKINICDIDVMDYLLVLHNLETTSGRGMKAFPPGFIPKGKENVPDEKINFPKNVFFVFLIHTSNIFFLKKGSSYLFC